MSAFIANEMTKLKKKPTEACLNTTLNGDSSKQQWQMVNGLINPSRTKNQSPVVLNINGNPVTDRCRIAESLPSFFVSVGPTLASSLNYTPPRNPWQMTLPSISSQLAQRKLLKLLSE